MPSEMTAWARQLKTFAEIPQVFRKFVDSFEPFPYVIYSPADSWGNLRTNDKLTCVYNNRIVILEKITSEIKENCYLFENINYVEQGNMLLYSWIKINGFVNGAFSTSIVEYNGVVKELFNSVIKVVRRSWITVKQGEMLDLSPLEFLRWNNYKFYNYSRDSMMTGAKIQQIVYQPMVREKFLVFFKKTKIIAHISILTDKELIIIKDEEQTKLLQNPKGSNGGIWMYIPLEKIISVNTDINAEKDMITLPVNLPKDTVGLVFLCSKQSELEALIDNIKQIKESSKIS